MRFSYVSMLSICLPLIVWLWGGIANTSVEQSAFFVRETLFIFYCLQLTVILIGIPFQQQKQLTAEYFQSFLLVIIIPLPFIVIAWMAAVISVPAIIKMVLVELIVAIFMCMVTQIVFYFKYTAKIDVLIGIILSTVVWSSSDQWQMWLK